MDNAEKAKLAKILHCEIYQIPDPPKARYTRCHCGGVRTAKIFKLGEFSKAYWAWKCKKCGSVQGIVGVK